MRLGALDVDPHFLIDQRAGHSAHLLHTSRRPGSLTHSGLLKRDCEDSRDLGGARTPNS